LRYKARQRVLCLSMMCFRFWAVDHLGTGLQADHSNKNKDTRRFLLLLTSLAVT